MKTENVQILFYGICEKNIQNGSQKLYNLLPIVYGFVKRYKKSKPNDGR